MGILFNDQYPADLKIAACSSQDPVKYNENEDGADAAAAKLFGAVAGNECA
jgi:hypothetical protein